MNYRKRNTIGVISFIIIILLMFNFNLLFELIDYRVLGKNFVGLKGRELFLLDINEGELTLDELKKYILDNFKKIGYDKIKKFDFSIYTRNIEGEDNFIEQFRIPLKDNFEDKLDKSLKIINQNEELLFKFVFYFKDKIYTSKIFSIKIVDDLYKKEGKISIDIDEFTKSGLKSFITIPKYLNLKSNSKLNVLAKHKGLDISGLQCNYDSITNKIILNNLVPLKEYSYIKLSTKNLDGVQIELNIKDLIMNSDNELQDYLSKIYFNSFGRYPYEDEYVKILEAFSNNKISIYEFLSSIISSEEFDRVNDTPKKIIDNIYFIATKQHINGRISTLVLEEFNLKLLDKNLILEAKNDILNKFLQYEESLEYFSKRLTID